MAKVTLDGGDSYIDPRQLFAPDWCVGLTDDPVYVSAQKSTTTHPTQQLDFSNIVVMVCCGVLSFFTVNCPKSVPKFLA
jgi:hypothetical protein